MLLGHVLAVRRWQQGIYVLRRRGFIFEFDKHAFNIAEDIVLQQNKGRLRVVKKEDCHQIAVPFKGTQCPGVTETKVERTTGS